MLKVKEVSKLFSDKKALDNVSFSVKTGKIAALLGENGAGKSTLLRVLSGFFEAETGEVFIDDIGISEREKYLNNVGYVQEISALYGEMTAYDFLDFVADLHKIPENEKGEKIKSVIKMLDLQDVLTQKNETLSKGYKKRLELAAVLLFSPKMLLLDEPTEGLDPNQKEALRKIIKQYAENHIIIISTHTLEDVEALAAQVLLLHKGKLLADKTLNEFKKEADNDLLASFRQATKN
ncbi:MAG: ABC transporter ATP-binding protein [Alphaproteobacteria bacterium]|nr:ABC transporter ATP-binding protein [Alphaproteobacteria bacterium]